jgi:hypothetical protein
MLIVVGSTLDQVDAPKGESHVTLLLLVLGFVSATGWAV